MSNKYRSSRIAEVKKKHCKRVNEDSAVEYDNLQLRSMRENQFDSPPAAGFSTETLDSFPFSCAVRQGLGFLDDKGEHGDDGD